MAAGVTRSNSATSSGVKNRLVMLRCVWRPGRVLPSLPSPAERGKRGDRSEWFGMRSARLFQTIDCHAAGEPLRIITGGIPPIPGPTMLARRGYMREHLDHVRRRLLRAGGRPDGRAWNCARPAAAPRGVERRGEGGG